MASTHLKTPSQKQLRVVPEMARVLIEMNPYANAILGQQQKVASLMKSGCSGVAIKWRFERNTQDGTEAETNVRNKKNSQSDPHFLYIPNVSSIWLIKLIELPVKKEQTKESIETLKEIVKEMNEPLNYLQQKLNIQTIKEMNEPLNCLQQKPNIQIKVLLMCKRNHPADVKNMINDEQIKLEVISKENVETVRTGDANLRKVFGEEGTENINLSQVLELMKLPSEKQEKLEFARNTPKIGDRNIDFKDREQVVEMTDKLCQQGRYERVQTIPSWDCIPDSMLYSTGETGEAQFPASSAYVGEVQMFQQFVNSVAKKENACGVFLKDLTEKSVSQLFRCFKELRMQFQIDWIYCGNKYLITIEVGRATQRNNASSVVRGKLEQVVTKTIPVMHFLIHNFLQTDERLEKFVKEHFRVAIFLLEVSEGDLKTYFQSTTFENTLFEQALEKLVPHLSFVIMTDKERVYKTFELKRNTGQSGKCKFTIEERKQGEGKIEEMMAMSRDGGVDDLDYVSSLFILASLKRSRRKIVPVNQMKTPTDNERYRHKSKGYATTAFFLSPQQHKVMNKPRERDYVILDGEAGSGKTVMLCEKAVIMAKDPEIDHVLIAYHFVRRAYGIHLQNMIQKALKTSQQKQFRQKVHLISTKFFGFGWKEKLAAIYKCRSETSTHSDSGNLDLSRIALFFDEVYLDGAKNFFKLHEIDKILTQCDEIRPLRTCWVARTCAIRSDILHQKKYENELETFAVESLHVLFRSSHFISRTVHDILDKSQYTGHVSAKVTGVFPSEQDEFKPCFYTERKSTNRRQTGDQSLGITTKEKKEWLSYYRGLQKRFASERILIVITCNRSRDYWMQKLAKCLPGFSINDRRPHCRKVLAKYLKFISLRKNKPTLRNYTTCRIKKRHREMPKVFVETAASFSWTTLPLNSFTGIETKSVCLIIDRLAENVDNRYHLKVLSLALTRAQNEVQVMINSKLKDHPVIEDFFLPSKRDEPFKRWEIHEFFEMTPYEVHKNIKEIMTENYQEQPQNEKQADQGKTNAKKKQNRSKVAQSAIQQRFEGADLEVLGRRIQLFALGKEYFNNSVRELSPENERKRKWDTLKAEWNSLKENEGKRTWLKKTKLLYLAFLNNHPGTLDSVMSLYDQDLLQEELNKDYLVGGVTHTLLTAFCHSSLTSCDYYKRINVECIESILDKGFDSGRLQHQFNNKTFFKWAEENKEFELLKFFISDDRTKSVYLKGLEEGLCNGILFTACELGQETFVTKAIQLLEEKKVSLECELRKIHGSETCLMRVCGNFLSSEKSVESLLLKGFPNEHLPQRDGFFHLNALDWAIVLGKNDVVKLLLSDEERCQLLFNSAKKESEHYERAFRVLNTIDGLKKRSRGSIVVEHHTVLHLAKLYGNETIVSLIEEQIERSANHRVQSEGIQFNN